MNLWNAQSQTSVSFVEKERPVPNSFLDTYLRRRERLLMQMKKWMYIAIIKRQAILSSPHLTPTIGALVALYLCPRKKCNFPMRNLRNLSVSQCHYLRWRFSHLFFYHAKIWTHFIHNASFCLSQTLQNPLVLWAIGIEKIYFTMFIWHSIIIYWARPIYYLGSYLFHTFSLAIYSKIFFPVWLIFQLSKWNVHFL